MHEEILTEAQKELLPLVRKFSGEFGLVGGTAVALQIGHRRSIDFDLFTLNDFDTRVVRDQVRGNYKIESTLFENPNQLSLVVDGVKITFFKYPFEISYTEKLDATIKMPDLLILAAMKAFALGRRAKWKDYVDLFFIFKTHSLPQVAQKARILFGGEFNEKLFREQLNYFADIDYSEKIDYLPGSEIKDAEVRQSLQQKSFEK